MLSPAEILAIWVGSMMYFVTISRSTLIWKWQNICMIGSKYSHLTALSALHCSRKWVVVSSSLLQSFYISDFDLPVVWLVARQFQWTSNLTLTLAQKVVLWSVLAVFHTGWSWFVVHPSMGVCYNLEPKPGPKTVPKRDETAWPNVTKQHDQMWPVLGLRNLHDQIQYVGTKARIIF